MGLNFRHSNVCWGYSGFNLFRERLASEIGIDLRKMEGFGGGGSWVNIIDPIVPFLNHSDCEGELTPSECLSVAPRLRQLIANWPNDDRDKSRASELADDMERFAKDGQPLVFT